MEKLDRYLRDNKIRRYVFAESVGVAKSTMTEILAGKYLPSLKVALAIEAATGGGVTCGDWEK